MVTFYKSKLELWSLFQKNCLGLEHHHPSPTAHTRPGVCCWLYDCQDNHTSKSTAKVLELSEPEYRTKADKVSGFTWRGQWTTHVQTIWGHKVLENICMFEQHLLQSQGVEYWWILKRQYFFFFSSQINWSNMLVFGTLLGFKRRFLLLQGNSVNKEAVLCIFHSTA